MPTAEANMEKYDAPRFRGGPGAFAIHAAAGVNTAKASLTTPIVTRPMRG